jgi:hypothetical protein
MMRHTGGLASGATSTRSRSSSRANTNASAVARMPTWLPSGPMRRTSRARMRSLYRGSLFCGVTMTYLSCAMGLALLCVRIPRAWVSCQRTKQTQNNKKLLAFSTCRTCGGPVGAVRPHFAQLTCNRVSPDERRRHHAPKESRNR